MQVQKREYTTYKFNELSDDAKSKALELMRDVNTDFDEWHDPILEYWRDEKLPALGYDDVKILYSGFSSQGDGACFESKIDTKKWLTAHKFGNKYRALLVNADNVTICIKHTSNHYYYATSTNIETENYINSSKVDDQLAEVEKLIEDEREKLGNELYRALESYYCELMSDEGVTETIEANDYDFFGDGRVFTL